MVTSEERMGGNGWVSHLHMTKVAMRKEAIILILSGEHDVFNVYILSFGASPCEPKGRAGDNRSRPGPMEIMGPGRLRMPFARAYLWLTFVLSSRVLCYYRGFFMGLRYVNLFYVLAWSGAIDRTFMTSSRFEASNFTSCTRGLRRVVLDKLL